jgi:myo-inositol-1(or 4)-monophosphatase
VELSSVIAKSGNIRRLGAASLDLAMVAAGRLDCYWERGLLAWDMAAGIVLVREAGGYVSDADGGDKMLESGSVCVGNETMQRSLLAALRAA